MTDTRTECCSVYMYVHSKFCSILTDDDDGGDDDDEGAHRNIHRRMLAA